MAFLVAGPLALDARIFAGQSIRHAGGRDFEDDRLQIMARARGCRDLVRARAQRELCGIE